MAYTAPTTIAGSDLITKAIWESDHYDNWEWLSSFTYGGVTLSALTLPVSLGAGVWQLSYEPGSDFASVSFDLSGLATRYRRVRVVGANLRTDRAAFRDGVVLSIANDKTNTYYYSSYRSIRATPTFGQYAASAPGFVMLSGASGTTAANQCWGNFEATLYQPREADYPYMFYRTWGLDTTTDQILHNRGIGHYYQSGAIDRIDLDPLHGSNFLTGGAGEPTTRIDVYAHYGIED